jgi:hypothetical protein
VCFIKCYLCDKTKEDDMGITSSIHGKNEECIHSFDSIKG